MKHQKIITLLIMLLCISLLQFACSDEATEPTPPPPVPRIYKIAFSFDFANDEHNEIYTIKPDGTELTRLTVSPIQFSNLSSTNSMSP